MSTVFPVKIFPEQRKFQLPTGKIRNLTFRVYSGEKIPTNRRTNLICCSDYSIRRLNRDYRNIDKVTDVLSFPFEDNDFLGEIYISIKRTGIQARRFGHSFNQEFLRLVVHGLLHLAGFDHLSKTDRIRMNEKENHYLQECMY